MDRLLPKLKAYPSIIHQAMRYSVFGDGKRIRPVLVLAAAEACGAPDRRALAAACSIEFIHTYSLIHDDLPCLDNDNLRRGRPTLHKKFDEAQALLAGDALLTFAFEVLAGYRDPRMAARLVTEISRAAGTYGMIGGQVVDKLSESQPVNLPVLDYINVNKTGKLIRVSCLAGAICAVAPVRSQRALATYGEYLGLAFQIVDDIMDGNGYMQFMSESQARTKAVELTEKAKQALVPFGRRAEILRRLADAILARKK
ncbi:MAG: polyprenyl synthetase family protein [Candidatus Omnitrophica bacterium]|nr:polyprenyl synthetase family protein [Candidatus Omnitrophota bacterium]